MIPQSGHPTKGGASGLHASVMFIVVVVVVAVLVCDADVIAIVLVDNF